MSKFASDTVAGVIESVADRRNNYRLRTSDFRMSAKALFSCFERMELAFPKNDILSLMSRPADFIRVISERSKSMEIRMHRDFSRFDVYLVLPALCTTCLPDGTQENVCGRAFSFCSLPEISH